MQGHVETADRVEGVDECPPEGGRSDEVGPEVVAQGEAGDPGQLGRVAQGELTRKTHVKCRVEGDERVEQKGPRRIETIPRVLGEGKQGQEGQEGSHRSPKARPLSSLPGAEGQQGGPASREGEGREEQGSRQQAQPVGTRAKSRPQGQDEGGLDRLPKGPLHRDAGPDHRQGHEGEPGEERGHDRETQSGLEFTWNLGCDNIARLG